MQKVLLITFLVAAMAGLSTMDRASSWETQALRRAQAEANSNGKTQAALIKVLTTKVLENEDRILKIQRSNIQLEEEMAAMKIAMDIEMEVAACPRGLVNPRTGEVCVDQCIVSLIFVQDSALVACVHGVCPDPVPAETCKNLESMYGM